ncbi:MAG: DUF1553 domain-containing protein [Verrucomicrobiae bacterium]|nr:DUF1553 domain-containing protein [Verrucomicrobiae bacterium]
MIALVESGGRSDAAEASEKSVGSRDDVAFFETHIRPALIEHCYECHSEEQGKRKGGLWLDRRSGWAEGGDSGPAIVPRQPDQSLLLTSLRYHDPDLEMPPKEKLPEELVAKFEEWIRRGAPDPRSGNLTPEKAGIDLEKGREFWSFQPIRPSSPPEVKDETWPKGAVDRFVLADLESRGMSPVDDADRLTLLRRIHLVLTGFPPSPAEQRAFLEDHSPRAFESVVERLLASDSFAERWARHWLDIARYADTSGGGRALTFSDAWRFRDYVIDSFRKDKPLDQLIREHVAGDLLPSENTAQHLEQLTGTGFLVLGPHNYENQDKELLELEIVDEQLDTIGQAFLGMTIGCARCHDHKFDPIPTSDYYAMAGIFTSTHSVDHANVSKWSTQTVAVTDEQQREFDHYEKTNREIETRIGNITEDLGEFGGNLPKQADLKSLRGIVLDNSEAERTGEWTESTSNHRFAGDDYLFCSGAGGDTSYAVFRMRVPEDGRYEVRVAYSTGSNRVSDASITVWHAGGDKTIRIDQRKPPRFGRLFESVGVFPFEKDKEVMVRIGNQGTRSSGVVVADAVQLVPEAEAIAEAETAPDREWIDSLEAELETLKSQQRQLKKEAPKLPSVMCVAEAAEMGDTPVRVGGMARNFGETPKRGFLRVALPASESAPVIDHGSGRLEFAEWLTSPDNPLTARVMANRIWLHLFGEGIVSTPTNFGTTGTAPTNPALLDFIAGRLIANRWSTKQTIREIVLSHTWQLSSENDAANAAIDPQNRLLWRANRRKIDAEAFRDSILAVSGTLDDEHGGPSLPSDFKSEFGYVFTSMKRSVYLPVFRNRSNEVMAAFNFANPNFVVGKRNASNIPTQALFLMNDAFIHRQAEAAARALIADTPDAALADRLQSAWRMVLCRDPREDEIALALPYLRSEGVDSAESLDAWTALMRTLFACLDFQYYR